MKAIKVADEIQTEAKEVTNKPLYFFSSRQTKMARIHRVGIVKVRGERRLTVEGELYEDKVLGKVEEKCREQLGKWIKAKKYATGHKGVRREEEERIRYKAMKELAETIGVKL